MIGSISMKALAILGFTTGIILVAPATNAKTAQEVQQIVRATVVEIKLQQNQSVGSGVIIHRQGDTYTLVTNRHVVCGKSLCAKLPVGEKYSLKTGDGQPQQINKTTIKFLGQDLDLALIQFRSSKNYPVASLANVNDLKVQMPLYTAGYPRETGSFAFGAGQMIAVGNRRLAGDKGGYTVIYNAVTLPGMSGGGVFNSDGKLVAIHGVGDRYRANTDLGDRYNIDTKIGYNRGISIRWLQPELQAQGLLLPGSATPVPSPNNTPSADERFITGFNLFVDPGDNVQDGKKAAINEFTKAIQIQPRYIYAYFARAYIYDQLAQYRQAIADYDQVIILDSQYAEAYLNRGAIRYQRFNDVPGALADYNRVIAITPTFSSAFFNRGTLKDQRLKDPQGALADYSQAIALDPKFFYAYNNRGYLKYSQLQDFPGALADYNQAITINPKFADAYSNRGRFKAERLKDVPAALADFDIAIKANPGDAVIWNNRGLIKYRYQNNYQGALADYNQSIIINPKYALAYSNRASLKSKLNDHQGALADYNQLIKLDPKYVSAYIERGLLRQKKFNDLPGALADFNQVVSLEPQMPLAYINRGSVRYLTKDNAGALQDFRQAAQLYRQQGQQAAAKQVEDLIREIGG
jgi:tetratricopeptide (TPR) repeat protein